MRRDRNLDQRVAGGSTVLARRSLAAQPDLLAIFDTRWSTHFEFAAVARDHAAHASRGGFLQRDGGFQQNIGAFARLAPALGPTAAQPAKQIGKDVLCVQALTAARPLKFISARAGAARTFAHAFKALAKARARTKALVETFRLTIGVDLAPVVLRPLFLVAQ